MLGLRREDEDVNRREYFLALEQVILYNKIKRRKRRRRRRRRHLVRLKCVTA
jgi:hypothetical protein